MPTVYSLLFLFVMLPLLLGTGKLVGNLGRLTARWTDQRTPEKAKRACDKRICVTVIALGGKPHSFPDGRHGSHCGCATGGGWRVRRHAPTCNPQHAYIYNPCHICPRAHRTLAYNIPKV